MSNHSLDLFRNYVFGKLINKEIDLAYFSRVIYQDNFFSKEDFEATKNDCFEYSWRAKEEIDEYTYREVVRAFDDLANLIAYESITQALFEEYFFTAEHIIKR